MGAQKFYWLKLKKDFFKRHDIKILEGMPNGKEIVLFYLKLLCESVDHDGELRFSDSIPYTSHMLASVTNTELAVAEQGIKILEELGMLVKDKEETIIMKDAVRMLGCESAWAEKKRAQRTSGGQSGDNVPQVSSPCPPSVPKMSDKSIEKEKDIRVKKEREKEKEREKDGTMSPSSSLSQEKKKRFVKPTVEEVKAYCEERGNGIDPQTFIDYYESKGWVVGKNSPMKDWKASVRNWESRRRESRPSTTSYKKVEEIPIMENEYTKEHLDQKELESMLSLDRLLEE